MDVVLQYVSQVIDSEFRKNIDIWKDNNFGYTKQNNPDASGTSSSNKINCRRFRFYLSVEKQMKCFFYWIKPVLWIRENILLLLLENWLKIIPAIYNSPTQFEKMPKREKCFRYDLKDGKHIARLDFNSFQSHEYIPSFGDSLSPGDKNWFFNDIM